METKEKEDAQRGDVRAEKTDPLGHGYRVKVPILLLKHYQELTLKNHGTHPGGKHARAHQLMVAGEA